MLPIDLLCIGLFSLFWGILAFGYLAVSAYKEAKKFPEELKQEHIERLRTSLKAVNERLPEGQKILSSSIHFPDEKEPRDINLNEK